MGAFKAYDEMGSPERISCLKMVVLSNMLAKMKIDPFESPETRSYKTHREIEPMTELVKAYQADNLVQFVHVLKQNPEEIEGDAMIAPHIAGLKRNIRINKLIEHIKPYTVVRTSFLAKKLRMDEAEVEELLVQCVLDEKVGGRLDQVEHLFYPEWYLTRVTSDGGSKQVKHHIDGKDTRRTDSLAAWTRQLNSLFRAIGEAAA